MMRPLMVACFGIVAIGCQDVTAPQALAGQYGLIEVDGAALGSCCSQADSGHFVGGELNLAEDGTYLWRMDQAYVHADTTSVSSLVFSSGNYVWADGVLTLTDTSTSARAAVAGLTRGDTIVLYAEGHRYGFLKRPPPSIAGQWALTGFDGSRNLPCCHARDSTGALVSVAGGFLEISTGVPEGSYKWDLVRLSEYPSGTSKTEQVPFSIGEYWWAGGSTFALLDSTGLGSMSGSFSAASGNVITIQALDHRYEFLRVLSPR